MLEKNVYQLFELIPMAQEQSAKRPHPIGTRPSPLESSSPPPPPPPPRPQEQALEPQTDPLETPMEEEPVPPQVTEDPADA